MLLKLSEVPDTKFEVELPGGEKKSYDPWDLIRDIHEHAKATPKDADEIDTVFSSFDAVRKAMGLPPAAEAKAAGSFTLSPNMAKAVTEALTKFMEGLSEAKKEPAASAK